MNFRMDRDIPLFRYALGDFPEIKSVLQEALIKRVGIQIRWQVRGFDQWRPCFNPRIPNVNDNIDGRVTDPNRDDEPSCSFCKGKLSRAQKLFDRFVNIHQYSASRYLDSTT
jgi:hypothetical protein